MFPSSAINQYSKKKVATLGEKRRLAISHLLIGRLKKLQDSWK